MRVVGYGLVGLVLGALGGFWFGLMAGLIYTDFARVSCFEGLCGYVAGAFGALGAVAGGVAAAGYGVRRATRRAERGGIDARGSETSTRSTV
jgi:hypothetical protein